MSEVQKSFSESPLDLHSAKKQFDELRIRVKEFELKGRRFDNILSTLIEGVWIIDPNGISVYVNSRLAMMFGYDVSYMIGKSFYDFMDDSAAVQAKENLAKRTKGEAEVH